MRESRVVVDRSPELTRKVFLMRASVLTRKVFGMRASVQILGIYTLFSF